MTHDRMHEQDFHLSYEVLGGHAWRAASDRQDVPGTLQAGLIRESHGRVAVRNRKGREAASCEGYPIIRAHFDRLRQ